MTSDNVTDPGAETMRSGPPVDNLSGSVRTVGATVRQNRGPDGRWKPRTATLTRGLDPSGSRTELVRDAVTGQMIQGRDNSMLMRNPMEFEAVHYVAPDYSRYVEPGRKSNGGLEPAQDALNHIVSCPSCATGGACNA